MKIAVIGSKGLPPRQGGIEHHCAEIYPRMAAEGHRVEVFARSSYNHLPGNARFFYQGVQVTNLPSVPMKGFDALVNSGMAAIIASLKGFDIIHFHALGPSLFCWMPRLLCPRAKVVVTCHGLDWQRSKWGKLSTRLLKLGEQIAVRYAHEIGVVSEELKRYFWEKYRRETTYIGNAPARYPDSDTAFTFGRSQDLIQENYILFLGRLVPEKRPDLLIKAFRQIQSRGWKLVFVGGASDTPRYVQQLQRLAGTNADVVFMGELRGERLAEIVRGAGLFVLPSAVEGLPLALLEAMQEGVPVIASDIPVHRHTIGEDRGLLFREGNVNDCATVLSWAMQNPDAMKLKSANARRYIQLNHNWEHIAGDWTSYYERLLGIASSVKASAIL